MKKVLIVTYYWPPAGGPGVQRWLKFVKYLPEFGIEPHVYVPENPNYPIVDETLVSESNPAINIIKHPIFEPYALGKLISKRKTNRISSGIITEKNPSLMEKFLLFIRGNLFIPDARMFWVNPSKRFLKKYIQDHHIDTLITSGPPHSLHLIGLKLKKELNIRWIADFRDPWTTISYHSKLRMLQFVQKKHLRMEQEVLQTADEIIVTSRTLQQAYQKITKKSISLITNGFDQADFEKYPLDTSFSITHIGSMLSGRNPVVLWEALKELVKEQPEFKKQLKIRLVGIVGQNVINALSELGLMPFVQQLGYVSHEEAVKLQHSAQLLLLAEIDSADTKVIIPGKFFEYLSAKRPILAIGPNEWEINELIEQTSSGRCFHHQQQKEIKDYIWKCFQAFQSGNLTVQSKGIEAFSRKELTQKLAEIIYR
ncbi:MAG: glycosyltransferase family 4 protein [Flavobacteriaceae bacterium]|nr:glycosyltransferase family 4 protein [Flavobacteriaceae bacterium]